MMIPIFITVFILAPWQNIAEYRFLTEMKTYNLKNHCYFHTHLNSDSTLSFKFHEIHRRTNLIFTSYLDKNIKTKAQK